ncbi:MAG: transketolase [Actinobacteria bacterium]|nr:transketolase [Actinomycetota bacterium]
MSVCAARLTAVAALNWTELDDRAVATARVLAMDAVQKVGNGHPGTAMALAPAAYLLFQHHLRHDPSDPLWLGRDRFVLSCGHSSLTLYIQLFLSGYDLTLEDLMEFRTAGSATPGHPEYGHTVGVETTTGPLGQGVATAVGMAMSQRYWRYTLDPHAPRGQSPFDHRVWVLASDGDLEEGISGEASSLAGTQKLDNLVVIYDDNRISIEGDTHRAFTEDVAARYQAYGWHTITVEHQTDGSVDVAHLHSALTEAAAVSDKPTLIRLRTVIAWPAPNARNTAKSHGSALGAAEVAATKEVLGFNPEESFVVDADVLEHTQQVAQRGAAANEQWARKFQLWSTQNVETARLLERLHTGLLPSDIELALPQFNEGEKIATRAAFGTALNALADYLPELWGGSADLAESNNTTIHDGGSFLPDGSGFSDAAVNGRIIHFGVREHAMGAIVNGIALDGLSRPFAGTFLVFSDYMRGAVRLSALMQTRSLFVWTHDSIGLGEDGPTHQPIEHLWALRAIPEFSVLRPADANETSVVFLEALRRNAPAGLVLTRQAIPVLGDAPALSARRGGYIIRQESGSQLDVILIATGSEVALAIESAEALSEEGIGARVVSMPSIEWFTEQPLDYQEQVLPKAVRARVAIEAGATQGWWRFVGTDGAVIGIDEFGASASAEHLFEERGFTIANVVTIAHETIERAQG